MAFDNPFAGEIWAAKYRFRYPDGAGDASIEDTWRRVATALSVTEHPSEREERKAEFLHALANFRFLPGGRIIAGAGTDRGSAVEAR